jgi:maltose-binding protein MalE
MNSAIVKLLISVLVLTQLSFNSNASDLDQESLLKSLSASNSKCSSALVDLIRLQTKTSNHLNQWVDQSNTQVNRLNDVGNWIERHEGIAVRIRIGTADSIYNSINEYNENSERI